MLNFYIPLADPPLLLLKFSILPPVQLSVHLCPPPAPWPHCTPTGLCPRDPLSRCQPFTVCCQKSFRLLSLLCSSPGKASPRPTQTWQFPDYPLWLSSWVMSCSQAQESCTASLFRFQFPLLCRALVSTVLPLSSLTHGKQGTSLVSGLSCALATGGMMEALA